RRLPENLAADLGSVVVRGEHTGVRLHCDAACATLDGKILLLSAAGPESAVKALAAALRSDARVTFVFDLDGFHVRDPKRCEEGYKVYRAKLPGDLWHILCVAKTEGFMPVLTEESLWRELRAERFTTPLLRAWIEPLMKRLQDGQGGRLAELRQKGCT